MNELNDLKKQQSMITEKLQSNSEKARELMESLKNKELTQEDVDRINTQIEEYKERLEADKELVKEVKESIRDGLIQVKNTAVEVAKLIVEKLLD